jgi:YHS domain-containing protein
MIKMLPAIFFSLAITLTMYGLNSLAHAATTETKNIAGNIVGEGENKGKIQCPVMKTWFVPDEKTDKAVYEGKTYYFCCKGCKPMFEKEPEKYLK